MFLNFFNILIITFEVGFCLLKCITKRTNPKLLTELQSYLNYYKVYLVRSYILKAIALPNVLPDLYSGVLLAKVLNSSISYY